MDANLKKIGFNLPKFRTIWKVLAAGRSHRAKPRKSLVLPRKRATHRFLTRGLVSSSRTSFCLYISLQRARNGVEQRELGFFSLGLVLGFLFLFLYIFIFFSSWSNAEIDSEERKRDIVLESDNLCKGVSFFLYYNLFHLLYDA